MIRLERIKQEERERFWNINQKYLYEMTNFYDDEMDEAGNYHYGYFEGYFTEPERKAFWLCEGETVVGFAMINPYSYLGEHPDHIMAEFTVFPVYRKRHYAEAAAKLILKTFPGRWEIKYNEKNAPAKALWTKVTAPYSPAKHSFSEYETVLVFQTDR